MKLSPSEEEHLITLGGYSAPRRALPDQEASPAMKRIVERLSDTPAIVFSRFGETLLQTPERWPCSATTPGSPACPGT